MSGRVLDVPLRVDLPRAELAALCRRHHVSELAVFGSAVRDDFRPDSDVDFLVKFENDDAGPWMSHLTGLQQDLARLLDRPVDVLDWTAIEKSRNPFRRRGILEGRMLLYVS